MTSSSSVVTTVLTLLERGVPKRKIARQLKISRSKVQRIAKNRGRRNRRPHKLDGRDDLLVELHRRYEGNAVLVCRALVEDYDLGVSYPTLHRRLVDLELIGPHLEMTHRFETEPGEESQADTSPYDVPLGGEPTHVELYRIILGYSRHEWGRFYLRFRRPQMKRGTYEALTQFGGACAIMVIDNTSVAVAEGTGKDALIAPEMAEFGRALGFVWLAHEKGHANRSGKVERGFYHVERNFLPGRSFRDLDDLNAQFASWLEKANARVHGTTGERPIDRLAVERPHLRPLPTHPIDLSEVVARKVTIEGFVNFETNRYSVPARYVGKSAAVHAEDERIRVFVGAELVATHPRLVAGEGRRMTDPSHHPRPAPQRDDTRAAFIAELHARLPTCAELAAQILEHHPNHFNQARRVLEELRRASKPEALESAARRALRFRAYDIRTLARILESDWHNLGGHDEQEP